MLSDRLCSALQSTGYFDKLEIKIFKALLNLSSKGKRKFTASAIANEAKISVTNTYKYLYALQLKGLVESNKAKNKLFWIARSSNPFPRLFSFLLEDFLEKEKIFQKASELWERTFPPTRLVWDGEKVYERYAGSFIQRATMLFDFAKSTIDITMPKLFTQLAFLKALERSAQRGVRIRYLAEEVDSSLTEKIKSLGVQVRLGKAWPYFILVDRANGLTLEDGQKGLWFLNYQNQKIAQRFESLWSCANEI